MAYEIYRSNRSISGQTSNVLANYDVSTGGQYIGRALVGLGKVATELALKYDRIQEENQLSESKRLANTEINKFTIGLEKNQDPDTYEKGLNKVLAQISGLAPKNKNAKREYQKWLNDKTPQWNKNLALKVIERQEDNWLSELTMRQANAEMGLDSGDFDKFLAGGYSEGLIDKKFATKVLYKTRINAQYNAGIKALEESPEAFLENIEDPKFLPRLDASIRLSLKGRARTEIGYRQSRTNQAREENASAEQNKLLSLAREGKLTNAAIRKSTLEPFGLGSKDTFYKMLDAEAESELEKKENPYLKSDPTVKASILQMMRDPNVEVKVNDISGLMGKGLSINDAQSMISKMDVYKGFWFRRADSYLKAQLGWSDSLTKFAHPEGGLAYSLATNELFDAIETEGLKGRDLLDRSMEISIPHLMDYWENVLMYKGDQLERLRKMLKAKTKTQVGRPPKKAREKSAIDPEGIFE